MLPNLMESTSLLFLLAPVLFLITMSITFLLLKVKAGKRRGQGFFAENGKVPPAIVGTKYNKD